MTLEAQDVLRQYEEELLADLCSASAAMCNQIIRRVLDRFAIDEQPLRNEVKRMLRNCLVQMLAQSCANAAQVAGAPREECDEVYESMAKTIGDAVRKSTEGI